MKKYLLIIVIIFLTACDNSVQPVLSPAPLNGKWTSVKLDETSYFIPVEMQLLEILQYNNGSVYGGTVTGSGGFEFGHYWLEFEITSGVTDRINNTIRFTFQTDYILINGNMIRSAGKFEGIILTDNTLKGSFQLSEIGRSFDLFFNKTLR
jgi:hypothetical protein